MCFTGKLEHSASVRLPLLFLPVTVLVAVAAVVDDDSCSMVAFPLAQVW